MQISIVIFPFHADFFSFFAFNADFFVFIELIVILM